MPGERKRPSAARRRELAAVLAGGSAGALLRLGVLGLLPSEAGEWPWATLTVNLGATFLLGCLVAARLAATRPPALRRPLLEQGLCGALTTFATVQIELLELLDRGALGLALVYAGTSVVGGLAAFGAGRTLAGRTRVSG